MFKVQIGFFRDCSSTSCKGHTSWGKRDSTVSTKKKTLLLCNNISKKIICKSGHLNQMRNKINFKYYNYNCICSRIFEKVIARPTFCVQQFFTAKVAIIKTKSATLIFSLLLLSSSSLFLFFLSSYFVSVILELIGPPKTAF